MVVVVVSDMWIDYYKKREKILEDEWKELAEKARREQMKHSCDNCGAKPPTKRCHYDGSFYISLEGFDAWLCDDCSEKMNKWAENEIYGKTDVEEHKKKRWWLFG